MLPKMESYADVPRQVEELASKLYSLLTEDCDTSPCDAASALGMCLRLVAVAATEADGKMLSAAEAEILTRAGGRASVVFWPAFPVTEAMFILGAVVGSVAESVRLSHEYGGTNEQED